MTPPFTPVDVRPALPAVAESPGPWKAAWKRMARQPSALVALSVLALICVLCVAGSILFQESQEAQNLNAVLKGPSAAHWMGTDNLGRDIFQRVLCGGGVSLLVGLVGTLVALSIGVPYGLVSGLSRPRVDDLMMRLVDALYAVPFMAFVILLTVVFERSLVLLFVAIGAVEWLTMARVVRGQTMALKNQEFVQAARVCGTTNLQILVRHMIPNVLGQVVIYATLTVPSIMLLEAVLSFLGLGVQPPASSWGTLIQDGAGNMETSPWMLAFPGGFFVVTLLCLNIVGDALRDALDPKSAHGTI